MDQWKALSSGRLSWLLRASKHQKRYHRWAIKYLLVHCDLPIQNLGGQTYDGASNMMGKKSGVAQQILKEQPKALITHCHGHSLSLSIEDANKQCWVLGKTMGTVGKIILLIKFSPKHKQMLGAIDENIELSSDTDNGVFEKVTALSKLTVCANAFNNVNSLYSYLRAYFCIFSVIYFPIFLTLHFKFGNNSFLCVASTCNMYWNLRVKLYVTEIQQIYFSI